MANTVYWVGRNGNVYFRSGDKVTDAGKLIKDFGNGFDAEFLSAESNRIDDPVAVQKEQAPASTGGGASAQKKVLNQAAVNATQQAIDSLGTELDTGYKNNDDSFNSLTGKYDQERARTKQDYDEETVSNTQSLQRNKQNALVAGAQGLRGLRGVLSSIGALGGDGAKLANQAVTTAANQDIGGATETAATNAQALDKAWNRFDEEDQDRRREAETARVNQRTALEGSIAGKRQNFYQKMAELYGDVDNTAAATDWLGKAGGLNQEIASKTRVAATPFQAKAAAYNPGDLDSYLAGAGDMTVSVNEGGVTAGPSTLNANNVRETEEQKRKRLTAVA